MFGDTLVIINPAARNGNASLVAAKAKTKLAALLEPHSKLTLYHTLAPKEATQIVREHAFHYDTVFTIGGDGIINEVINGLMQVEKSNRPQLGIIPCGNGDDFARSLKISRKPEEALEQLTSLQAHSIDVGKMNDVFFVETLSFGLDAAIALETIDLRRTTNQQGTSLYVRAGIHHIKNDRIIYDAKISFDYSPQETIRFYQLAIQNGKTYGGGFTICPEASIEDGLLDICYTTAPLSFFEASKVFLLAKKGAHVNHPQVHLRRAQHVSLKFSTIPATQLDGEKIHEKSLEVSLLPHEITVLTMP